jgi:hypothetical protein
MEDIKMKHSGKQTASSRESQPTLAPGMEMDELDQPATDKEIARNDYTSVTRLFIDRTE